MLNLKNSTSDKLEVVTSTTAAIDSFFVFADTDAAMTPSSNVTPDNEAHAIITAATTTIVAAPGASKVRNVKWGSLRNKDASLANTVTVRFNNGTAYELVSVTLAAGEELVLREGTWFHYDVTGGVVSSASYADVNIPLENMSLSGYLAETMSRKLCPEVNTAYATTGVLYLEAIWLRKGQRLNKVSFWSATTALGTGTHQIFGIYDAGRNLVAQTSDDTSTAWAANSEKKLSLTATYIVPSTGLYYLGILVAATTMPTLKGGTAKTDGSLTNAGPALTGTTGSGLTALPANPAAPAKVTTSIWGAVS